MTPARRVRRVLRWIGACGPMTPKAEYAHCDHPYYFRTRDRFELADALFAAEIEFVAGLAALALETIPQGAECEIINSAQQAKERICEESHSAGGAA